MTRNQHISQCPLCGGEKKAGMTTFTADFEFGVVVVKRDPALVCALCGTDWIQDDVAARLETIVADANPSDSRLKSPLLPKPNPRPD